MPRVTLVQDALPYSRAFNSSLHHAALSVSLSSVLPAVRAPEVHQFGIIVDHWPSVRHEWDVDKHERQFRFRNKSLHLSSVSLTTSDYCVASLSSRSEPESLPSMGDQKQLKDTAYSVHKAPRLCTRFSVLHRAGDVHRFSRHRQSYYARSI